MWNHWNADAPDQETLRQVLILLLRNTGAPGQTVSQVPIGVVGPHLLCPPPLVTSQSRVATMSGPGTEFHKQKTKFNAHTQILSTKYKDIKSGHETIDSVWEVQCQEERGKGGRLTAGNEMSTIVTRCAGPVENTEDSKFIKILCNKRPQLKHQQLYCMTIWWANSLGT